MHCTKQKTRKTDPTRPCHNPMVSILRSFHGRMVIGTNAPMYTANNEACTKHAHEHVVVPRHGMYHAKKAIAKTTQDVLAIETFWDKPHGAQQCTHRRRVLRLTTTKRSMAAPTRVCDTTGGRFGSRVVRHHGHLSPHFFTHARQVILSALPFSMHEGHLKRSKERVAVLGSQHMAQCVAICTKKKTIGATTKE